MSWWCATCARRGSCPLYGRVQGRCPWYVPMKLDHGKVLRELERHVPKGSPR